MRTVKNQKGSITIELMIAFVILASAISATVMVLWQNQSLTVDDQTNNEALYRAQTMLEQTRALSRQDFSSVASQSSVVDVSGNTSYTKKLDVASLDSFTKQATSTITWTIGGRNFTILLSTLLTDSQTAAGNKCSPMLSGDWTAPQIYGYADFPSSAGATGVSTKAGKAFVTSDPSNPGIDDFYAIDVSGAGPGASSMPILSHFSSTYGLTAVAVSGNYAFVTADSASYQLLVIDITDASNLSASNIVKKVDLTQPGDTAVGNTIAYVSSTRRLYVGLTKSSTGPEFYIFDVSNPLNPVQLGPGYEIGSAVNGIIVKNNITYVAVASNTQLYKLDVTNPSNITLLSSYTPAPTILSGQSIALDNNFGFIYFGRTGGNANPKLLAFSTSDLSSPSWTMNMGNQSGVYSMVFRSPLLFMTTADPNDGLQIWDVSGATPVRHDTSPLNIQQTATAGTDCYGNLLYVAQRSNRALQVIGPFVPFSYTLGNSGDIAVMQGSSVANTISANLVSGIAQNINFSISGLPANATYGFSPGSCKPSCTSTLTITTAASTPAGTYQIIVTATGGQTTTFNLTVQAKLTPTMTTILYNNTTGSPLSPQSGPVPPGTVVYDKATLSGTGPTPTGTVTIIFYKNKNNCTSASQTSTATLNAGSAISSTYTVKHNDTVSYQITYNGDANYNSTAGACQPLNGA